MKAVITDYEYDSVNQEKEIITKFGAEFYDLTEHPDVTLEEAVQDADALIVQYAEITAALIEKMERCKVIIRYGIGVNNIDVAAAGKKGIYVCNVPDYGIDEVSNHAVAMIMALHRKLPAVVNDMGKGIWNFEKMAPVKRLAGSTLGLVGVGRIPQMVAKKMAGFGVNIIATDPFIHEEIAKNLQVRLVDFDTLLAESDIISIHCPLTDKTEGLFDTKAFQAMKNTAIIVNTARGPVIKEGDLVQALMEGEIAAAGLDTFEIEPLPGNSPLLEMEQVICTPHCAWYSDDAIQILQKKVGEEIVNIFGGGKPFNPVNAAAVESEGNLR